MLRVLIADDHEIVRHGVRDLVTAHSGSELVAEAAEGHAACALDLKTQPNVAVLDVGLRRLNGATATRLIRKGSARTRVLLFTMHEDEETVYEALAAGARGYLLKAEGDQQLEEAISA